MGYATREDLDQRFGDAEIAGLLDRDNLGFDGDGTFENAVSDSSALIDGYLAGSYTTPLTTIPGLITAICCDIVRFKLWDDRAPDEVRKRYEDAMRQLRDISNGVLTLPAQALTPNSDSGISYSAPCRLFTAKTLYDY